MEEVLLKHKRTPVHEALFRNETLPTVDGPIFVVSDERRPDGRNVLEALNEGGVTSSKMRWGTFWILHAGL